MLLWRSESIRWCRTSIELQNKTIAEGCSGASFYDVLCFRYVRLPIHYQLPQYQLAHIYPANRLESRTQYITRGLQSERTHIYGCGSFLPRMTHNTTKIHCILVRACWRDLVGISCVFRSRFKPVQLLPQSQMVQRGFRMPNRTNNLLV